MPEQNDDTNLYLFHQIYRQYKSEIIELSMSVYIG